MSKLLRKKLVGSATAFRFSRNDNKILGSLEKTASRDVFIREYIANRTDRLIIQ